jgi:hypothetical protein
MSDAQIIHNSETSLKVRHRADDKTTELQFVWYGEQLAIYISIEQEHAKRTTYASSKFCCGPDIAGMIANAAANRAEQRSRQNNEITEHSHE